MTLPNFLTLFRVIILIPFVALFFSEESWASWARALIFFAACVTDYLDGFLARAFSQMSRLGRVLDPIADKLLIGTTVLMLAGTGIIRGYHLIPGVIILCREILVSGLREFLMEVRVRLPVSKLSKWKTAIQMLALGLLVQGGGVYYDSGMTLFWIAGFLTLLTGYDYLKASIRHLKTKGGA